LLAREVAQQRFGIHTHDDATPRANQLVVTEDDLAIAINEAQSVPRRVLKRIEQM
jgi:hypothetical protein